ncbi:MAG TPA: cytochrome b [Roseateles sp.]
MSTATRYTPVAVVLHWLMALAIIGTFSVGLYMADLPMPAWQAQVAHGVHWLLYAVFFAVPLTGWAMSSAKGFPIVWFGVLPLPDFVSKDKELGELLTGVHGWLAYGLAALVLAHVAGALKHHFVDRDGLLARMSLRRS